MAQRKAIFIGRNHPDNGIVEYRKLAKRMGVRLDEYINVPNADKHLKKYDYAFVSRYLAIVEALAVGLPVYAHYNNQIKFDYLNMAPFAKYITIFKHYREVDTLNGQTWAKGQTWEKIADIYEKLWKK